MHHYSLGHVFLVMLFTAIIAFALASALWAGRIELAKRRERRAAYAEAQIEHEDGYRETDNPDEHLAALKGGYNVELYENPQNDLDREEVKALLNEPMAPNEMVSTTRTGGIARWVFDEATGEWVPAPKHAEYVTEAFSIDDDPTPPPSAFTLRPDWDSGAVNNAIAADFYEDSPDVKRVSGGMRVTMAGMRKISARLSAWAEAALSDPEDDAQ